MRPVILIAVTSLAALSCDGGHRGRAPRGPCLTCHAADKARGSFPDHSVAGFPDACETCHGTDAWSPATFDHDVYPLLGQHATTPCAGCHDRPAPLPRSCVGCHDQDRARATFPDHRAAGFPTACESCHNTSGWKPATFNHDPIFIISSGPHRVGCSECHTDPQQPVKVTCLKCHHTKAKMDEVHQEEAGYSYDTAACLKCHPRGTGED